MIAALILAAPSLALVAWLVVAAIATREPRKQFALAYVHADDVARFVAEGWYEVGVDRRYGSRIMRYDGAHAPQPQRRVVLGRGA